MTDAEGNFAVIGLGLIGGSLARDLAAFGARVSAFDSDPATLEQAVSAGVVHRTLSASLAELGDADAIVLAVPVTQAPLLLADIAQHAGRNALITDVGSTKLSIQDAARALGLGPQFVGGHPLAGDHRTGWGASRTGLFRGARVVLCPAPETRDAMIGAARELWRALGADVAITSAEEHDRLLAWTSHLPQAAAFVLAATLARAGIGRQWLGPGGRDTMRLAASPPGLWTGIALDNALPLHEALLALKAEMAELEEALLEGDTERVLRLFEAGRHWFCAD